MARKGDYNGGNTLIGPQNQSWFGQSKGKKPKKTKPGALEIALADFKATGLTPNQTREIEGLKPGYKKR